MVTFLFPFICPVVDAVSIIDTGSGIAPSKVINVARAFVMHVSGGDIFREVTTTKEANTSRRKGHGLRIVVQMITGI